jgi:hypothetical protein
MSDMWIRAAVWTAMTLASLAGSGIAFSQSMGAASSSSGASGAAGGAGGSGSSGTLVPPVAPIPSPITDYFSFRGSFFDPKATTTLRLDPSHGAGLGTPFNAEQELGLDEKPYQGRVEFYFRLKERSRVRFDYFEVNRSAEKALSEPLVFGNNVFPSGTPFASAFDWKMFTLTYTYSFLRNSRFELGAGVGVTAIQATVMGSEPLTPLRTNETGVGAVPTLAVDGTWRITRRFAATFRGQYFGATISNVKGQYGDYHADLQFRALPNLAFGVGYAALDATLRNESSSDSLLGQFEFKVAGPEAFVRVSF